MTLHFLEALPREIRDQIYIYVLAGPSGLVNFSPWTFDVARSLSLLKTCKQIHRECKDIIWQHNGLHPRTPSELFLKFQELERFRFMQYFRHIDRLQHLTICLELLDWDELQWISQALKELEIWKPRRRFESIKLITVRDRPRDIAEFKDVVRLRMDGELVDGRQYFNCSTSFDHIVVDTCWPKFSPWGKQRLLREMLLDTGNPSELLRDIHNAYGGELYIDGVLCFADYIQVVDAIQLDPRDGEINICPKNIGTGR